MEGTLLRAIDREIKIIEIFVEWWAKTWRYIALNSDLLFDSVSDHRLLTLCVYLIQKWFYDCFCSISLSNASINNGESLENDKNVWRQVK